ncbi:MAG: hypothetical protein FWD96_02195 [Defluviitaleaceae bacterium]|nr:hypothetical protein [Defluviitaleaceae bacterium]
MYIFDNLGLCHNHDGIDAGFAKHLRANDQTQQSQGSSSGSGLNASEVFMLAVIAHQLLDARD